MNRSHSYRAALRISLVVALLVAATLYFRDSILWYLQPMDPRPTYILIVLDDLDWDLVADEWLRAETPAAPAAEGAMATPAQVRFPELQQLAKQGLVFTNFHATTPVCGPARASILSGQYASRHRVRVNRPSHPTAQGFPGGFSEYGRSRDFVRHLQVERYQTCFVGKYVHDGFEPDPMAGVGWGDLLPHGWDRFHACMGAQYNQYWTVDSADPRTRKVADQFRTDYEADRMIAMLEEQRKLKRAQILCWFALAPHDSTEAEVAYPVRCSELYTDAIPPSRARQMSSQGLILPQALQALPTELTDEQREFIQVKWVERLRSVKAFDENLGRLRQYLAEQGRLENTIFLITSDHGFRLGDHGHVGKRLPYDPITRVPLLISGKGVRAGRCDELLANIDLAPTLLELTKGTAQTTGGEMDGQSFAALLTAESAATATGRSEVLLEGWEAENVWGQRVPGVWSALRTPRELFTEWASGEREYYEMDKDPWQLQNQYRELSHERVADLRARLSRLRNSDRPPLLSLPRDAWEPIASTPQNPCFSPIIWSGFVDADRGIEQVQMQIFDPDNQVYWDGQSWVTNATDLPTRLENPNGLVSRWEFRLHVPPNSLATSEAVNTEVASIEAAPALGVAIPERTVRLLLKATGVNGKVAELFDAAPVQLRLLDPETWFDPPNGQGLAAPSQTLTGWAVGHTPIRFVRLVIRDTIDQTFWNGETWVPQFTQVNAKLGAEGPDGRQKWEYDFVANPPNPLYMSARAVDRSGNFDKTVALGGGAPRP